MLYRLAITLWIVVNASIAGAQPAPLGPKDLEVGGIAYGADTVAVRRGLGAPDRVAGRRWDWQGLFVDLDGATVYQIHLTTRAFATYRGLRVGDPRARVRELYGEPCDADELLYCIPGSNDTEVAGIWVLVDDDGRVLRIIIGAVINL